MAQDTELLLGGLNRLAGLAASIVPNYESTTNYITSTAVTDGLNHFRTGCRFWIRKCCWLKTLHCWCGVGFVSVAQKMSTTEGLNSVLVVNSLCRHGLNYDSYGQ